MNPPCADRCTDILAAALSIHPGALAPMDVGAGAAQRDGAGADEHVLPGGGGWGARGVSVAGARAFAAAWNERVQLVSHSPLRARARARPRVCVCARAVRIACSHALCFRIQKMCKYTRVLGTRARTYTQVRKGAETRVSTPKEQHPARGYTQ